MWAGQKIFRNINFSTIIPLIFFIGTIPFVSQVFAQGVLDKGDTDFDFLSIFGALIVAIVTFFLPFHYARKGVTIWGSTEAARLFDGAKFLFGKTTLLSKYDQGKEISETDMKQAAENVRSELVVVQAMILTGLTKEKRIFRLYSDVIVETVDAYKKFLKEFEPAFPELEPPLMRIYTTAQDYLKKGKLVKDVTI